MIRGMRLGIWVLRLYIFLNFVVWDVWGRGVWAFLYSWVKFVDVDMFIILYYRSNGHICSPRRNPALRFPFHRSETSHVQLISLILNSP